MVAEITTDTVRVDVKSANVNGNQQQHQQPDYLAVNLGIRQMGQIEESLELLDVNRVPIWHDSTWRIRVARPEDSPARIL